MPLQLEKRLVGRIKAEHRNKRDYRRFAVAASVTLAIILTFFYSGTIAQFMIRYFHNEFVDINKQVELEKDIWLTFDKIIYSTDETIIVYSVEIPSNRIDEFKDEFWIDLTLYSNDSKIHFQPRLFKLSADGTKLTSSLSYYDSIPLEDLEILVHGYSKRVHSTLEFDITATDTGKTLIIGGWPLTIEGIETDVKLGEPDYPEGFDEPVVLVRIATPSIMWYNVSISDRDGTREALNNLPWWNPDENIIINSSLFVSYDTEWRIIISPYDVYTWKNTRITF